MDAFSVSKPGSAGDLAEDELMLRARTDRDAFAELYVRHRDTVFRYLRARCGDDDTALDLAAVTFEHALKAIGRYTTRGGGALAWLLRIAHNAAVDDARRRQRRWALWVRSTDEWPALARSPEEAVVAADEGRHLRLLLAELPPTQRDAIALRFGAGMTAREIGGVIGKSEEATQKLIVRAVARLKEAYGVRQ